MPPLTGAARVDDAVHAVNGEARLGDIGGQDHNPLPPNAATAITRRLLLHRTVRSALGAHGAQAGVEVERGVQRAYAEWEGRLCE